MPVHPGALRFADQPSSGAANFYLLGIHILQVHWSTNTQKSPKLESDTPLRSAASGEAEAEHNL